MKNKSRKSIKTLIEEYAKQISLPGETAEEFLRAHSLVEKVKPFEVVDVFVDNYLDDTERMIYPNFCFFGEEYHAQASNEKEKSNEEQREIFVLSVKEGLQKVSIQNAERYDFKRASSLSRITIAFYLKSGESFFLNACGINCDILMRVYANTLSRLL